MLPPQQPPTRGCCIDDGPSCFARILARGYVYGVWRTLLRPSWWMLGSTVVFWLYRAGTLVALSHYDERFGPAIVLGFLSDALLVVALFFSARALTAVSAGARSRALSWIGQGVVASVMVAALLVRAADLVHCALAGSHFNSAGFLYLTAENIPLLADGRGPELVAFSLSSMAIAFVMIFLDGRGGHRLHAPSRGSAAPALCAMLCLVAVAGVGAPAANDAHHRFVPEVNFLHQWLLWRGVLEPLGDAVYEPTPAQLQRLKAAGLVPDSPALVDYPLFRDMLEAKPFPYPRVEGASETRPNLVFTLVEQLNRDFVHPFSGELEGVMPELSALAEASTMFTDFHSTASPTIHALVASQCGIHCTSNFRELNAGRGGEALVRTPFSCIAELLRKRGYRTVYIQGGTKAFGGKGDFLSAHGFNEVHGQAELLERFPDAAVSTWGVHDQHLVEYTKEQILRLEALKQQDGRPYFVMMLTLDTHSPGLPPPDCELPRELRRYAGDDEPSTTMLASLHCTDRALGELRRFLLEHERGQQTVWALTGDHPTSPMKFVREIYKRRHQRYTGWYGRLPLIIHDPLHQLPQRVNTLAGTHDIAPTLLHILGQVDFPNSMYGRSIFGSRRAHPTLIGRVGPEYVSLYRQSGVRNLSMGRLQQRCREGENQIFKSDPEALGACDLLGWAQWQNHLWKDKRLMPPALVLDVASTTTRRSETVEETGPAHHPRRGNSEAAWQQSRARRGGTRAD